MRIKVSFFGALEHLAEASSIDVELADGFTAGDVMRQVGQRLGDRFPPQVWDHRQQAFTPLVSIFIDSTEVEDLGHPVQDGCEVLMIMPLAGG